MGLSSLLAGGRHSNSTDSAGVLASPALAGSTIALVGSNLAGIMKVEVGRLDCAAMVISSLEIQIAIPAGLATGGCDIING